MDKIFTGSAKVLLPLLGLLIAAFVQGERKTKNGKPNVLFIAVDDLRPELGCYGNSIVKTPNIDRLSGNGTVFLNAYCQQAVCSPSRTSVLTGLRPNSTKVWDLTTHFRTTIPNAITLPQYFRQNGYFSQCIGKIFHDPRSAQDSLSWSAPEIMAVTDNAGKYALDSNKLMPGSGKAAGIWKAAAAEAADVPDSTYIDGQVSNAAVAFLRKKRDTPFFLAVGFRRPHLPFSAPRKYWEMYDPDQLPLPGNTSAPQNAPAIALHNWDELRGYRDIAKSGELTAEKTRALIHAYYASVSFVDAQVGKLLDELKRSGTYENTIIVLWSDHGFHLGEQGLWAKTTNYELDARVPLVIKPHQSARAAKTSALAELVDIYPTLADMCRLPVPSNLEGISLMPLLQYPGKRLKAGAFTQFPRPAQFTAMPKVMGYSLRTRRYRYTEWQHFQTGEKIAVELYDHLRDPEETINIADKKAYRSAMKSLSKMLQQGWRSALL